MEVIIRNIAHFISSVIEVIAIIVISIGVLRLIITYIDTFFHHKQHHNNAMMRIKFGSSLTLALELLLAADILATAVAPTWDDIGKLAAIATIRTGLNFFLEKEMANMEKRIKH